MRPARAPGRAGGRPEDFTSHLRPCATCARVCLRSPWVVECCLSPVPAAACPCAVCCVCPRSPFLI
eukprot:556140-Prymnesium_polylepis.1